MRHPPKLSFLVDWVQVWIWTTLVEGKMRVTNDIEVPAELKRKISPGLLMFRPRTAWVLGMSLTAIGLYTALVGDHDAFVYLIAPWLCPISVAVLNISVRFRPYRGVLWARNMRDVDVTDAAVTRLVELYRSDEARSHIWRQALKWAAIVLVAEGILAVLFRSSLNWSPPSSQNQFMLTGKHGFWAGLVGCWIGSYAGLTGDYIGWGLKTWASRESLQSERG